MKIINYFGALFLTFFLTSAAASALVEDEADNMVDFIRGTTGGAALRGHRELCDRSSDRDFDDQEMGDILPAQLSRAIPFQPLKWVFCGTGWIWGIDCKNPSDSRPPGRPNNCPSRCLSSWSTCSDPSCLSCRKCHNYCPDYCNPNFPCGSNPQCSNCNFCRS